MIAEGSSDELKNQVGGTRLEVTIAAGCDLGEAAQALAPFGDGKVHVDSDRRHVIVPLSDGTTELAAIVRDLDAAGLRLEDLAVRQPTLDDVFLTLTGHGAEAMPEAEPGHNGHVRRERQEVSV